MSGPANSMGEPMSGNGARVRRYRATHRRIDFVPSADVASIIDQHRDAGLSNCLSGVIDRLIRLGHAASGNSPVIPPDLAGQEQEQVA